MTTRDLAIAVAGARQPDGSFTLGERARQACPSWTHYLSDREARRKYGQLASECRKCDGRTWLPTFVWELEVCPGTLQGRTNAPSVEWHDWTCCGGSGQIQRVDEGLLRTLMEEAGYTVNYIAKEWSVAKDWENVREFRESRAYGQAPTLLEACAAALGVGA